MYTDFSHLEDQISTLLRTNERATRGDIEAYFENWLKNNVDKDSEVFVYYAGHGSPDPKSGKAFLVPYDGNPAFLEKVFHARSVVAARHQYSNLASFLGHLR